MKKPFITFLCALSLLSLCGMQGQCTMIRKKPGMIYVSGYILESDKGEFEKMLNRSQTFEDKQQKIYEQLKNEK
jgi:hypothetical protein